MTASYRPGLPPVLRNLSFSLQPGTSCGVVGRTGAALCSKTQDRCSSHRQACGVLAGNAAVFCRFGNRPTQVPALLIVTRVSAPVPRRVPALLLCLPGSGKSSLMLSLYRLIDINMGSVVLDRVDTASIALDCLRKQLAIIPQVGVVCAYTFMDRN